MPYISMKTSAKLNTGAHLELKEAFGKAISLIPGKSERWLMVSIEDSAFMSFAGDCSTPCAMLEVEIFGSADGEAYDALTGALCEAVESITGIKRDRIYVKYAEVGHWGCNGFNF